MPSDHHTSKKSSEEFFCRTQFKVVRHHCVQTESLITLQHLALHLHSNVCQVWTMHYSYAPMVCVKSGLCLTHTHTHTYIYNIARDTHIHTHTHTHKHVQTHTYKHVQTHTPPPFASSHSLSISPRWADLIHCIC